MTDTSPRAGLRGRLATAAFLAGALACPGACRTTGTTAASSPSPSPSPAGAPAAPPAATGASVALARLADSYWNDRQRADPVEATLLGYPGHDDRMPDESPEARARERARVEALRARIDAEVPAAALSTSDQVTRGLLLEEIARDLAFADCHLEEWAVDPRDGPQVAYLDLASLQPVKTPQAGQALLARWRAMASTLDQKIANLRAGLAKGKSPARSEAARVARQLDELLARPDVAWPLVTEPVRGTGAAGAAWPEAERSRFQRDLSRVVAEHLRPAFVRYRDVVRAEVLPRARPDDAVGIGHVPGGAACYKALSRAHTSLDVDPVAVHRLGEEELRRIRGEMERLGPEAVGAGSFAEIQRRLRTADPSLFFRTRDEVEATARAALARAGAAMPRFLGRLPRTGCDVRRIEEHEEKDAPIAYYRQPAIDGSRAGTYYVNTYEPATRPRFEAEALAFHEAIPGHHVQIALAQEMTGVPEFRKHLGATAFVEGWGLYAEGLADELGLYGSPLARMGRLSLEAWRAARLVVDTGIHALGWSRAQAVRFLGENTLIAGNNIENEVDRYIGWPGQALAYKLGELEIRRLRADAERRLGARFDLRRFHDLVLGSGAVSLGVLGAEVAGWIERR